MPINSGDKGKRGERMFAHFLKRMGWDARRGQQHRGGDDSPDVIHSVQCSNGTPVHFEVKFTEALRIREAILQAVEDAGEDKVPVVAWKRNRGPWMAILPMKDFLDIVGQ